MDTYRAEHESLILYLFHPGSTHQGGHIYKKNRHKSQYHCVRCGLHLHADVNAAINIKDKYILSAADWSAEQAVVNQPPFGVDMPAMGCVECDLPR